MSEADLSCTIEIAPDGTATVCVAGDVDLATAEAFIEAVVAPADQPLRSVVVDLSAVTFMDSRGIHGLLAAQRHLNHRRVGLRLGRLSPSVERTLETAGVLEIIPVADSATAG
jgi:anti-anti-sigma factor